MVYSLLTLTLTLNLNLTLPFLPVQVQSVVYSLLQYSTNVRGPEGEVLVEEAFKLWNAVLSSAPEVPQQLLDLLPSMSSILRRGKDNTAVFQILEGYFILGAGAGLQPYGLAIAEALTATVNNLHRDIVAGIKKSGAQHQKTVGARNCVG